jgi:hypothetical protein
MIPQATDECVVWEAAKEPDTPRLLTVYLQKEAVSSQTRGKPKGLPCQALRQLYPRDESDPGMWQVFQEETVIDV